MTVIYDMTSGQFIEDETSPQMELQNSCDATHHEELSLQLQTVESVIKIEKNRLPADLAYKAFLLNK